MTLIIMSSRPLQISILTFGSLGDSLWNSTTARRAFCNTAIQAH